MPDKLVIIILNSDMTASAQPPRAHVSVMGHEEVRWICPQGEASIQFKGDSPFESDHFDLPQGGSVSTGLPTRGELGRVYKYSVVGHMRGDRRDYVADPEVQVDN